jgi:hypothetical protein
MMFVPSFRPNVAPPSHFGLFVALRVRLAVVFWFCSSFSAPLIGCWRFSIAARSSQPSFGLDFALFRLLFAIGVSKASFLHNFGRSTTFGRRDSRSAPAGVMPERPRTLLDDADADPPAARLPRLRRLMAYLRDTDETIYLARSRELAFLATVDAGATSNLCAFAIARTASRWNWFLPDSACF